MAGVTTHMPSADNSRQTVIVRKYTTMDGLPFELLLLHNTHHWKRILVGSTYSRFTCPHNNGSSVNQKGKQNVWLVIYVCIGIVLVMKAQSLVTPNPWACVSCRMHAHHNIGTPFVGRAARRMYDVLRLRVFFMMLCTSTHTFRSSAMKTCRSCDAQ